MKKLLKIDHASQSALKLKLFSYPNSVISWAASLTSYSQTILPNKSIISVSSSSELLNVASYSAN